MQLERKDERNDCREGTGIKNGIESDRYIKRCRRQSWVQTPYVNLGVSSLQVYVFEGSRF